MSLLASSNTPGEQYSSCPVRCTGASTSVLSRNNWPQKKQCSSFKQKYFFHQVIVFSVHCPCVSYLGPCVWNSSLCLCPLSCLFYSSCLCDDFYDLCDLPCAYDLWGVTCCGRGSCPWSRSSGALLWLSEQLWAHWGAAACGWSAGCWGGSACWCSGADTSTWHRSEQSL